MAEEAEKKISQNEGVMDQRDLIGGAREKAMPQSEGDLGSK